MKKIEKIAEEYINEVIETRCDVNYSVAYQCGIRKGIEIAREKCRHSDEPACDMPFFLNHMLKELLEEEEASD